MQEMFNEGDLERTSYIVLVGGQPCPVNEYEWLASTLARGTRIRYRRQGTGEWRTGTFVRAWFYDGVIADVRDDEDDEGANASYSLSLGLRDELAVLPV